MEQGKVIQVFRFRATGTVPVDRIVQDIWEIGTGASTNAIASVASAHYVDGTGDTYEVITITDGVGSAPRKLCWDIPGRCRRERLCVVGDDVILDFRDYCRAFFA